MRYQLVSSAALVATVLAGDVTVIWQHHNEGNGNSLSVYDAARGEVVEHGCGSVLGDIDFSLVRDDGSGNFTASGHEYHIHSKPARSGGISCSTMFDAESTVVECSGVPWEDHVERRALAGGTLDNCFSDKKARANVRSLRARGLTRPTPTELVEGEYDRRSFAPTKVKRQQGVPIPPQQTSETVLLDDGHPTDWMRHDQKTRTHECRDGTCTATHTQGETFTIGFHADVSPFGWISGGFSVTQSWDESEGYSCDGENDEDVCVWFRSEHIGYWVQNRRGTVGTDLSLIDEFELTSPVDERYGRFYCVRGSGCGNIDDTDWTEGHD